MKITGIYYSSHFARAFKSLPADVRGEASRRERIFRNDCFDARLKTHKLKGSLAKYWSFSVNFSYRIVFEFIGEGEVAFVDIGDHGIYG